MKADFETVATFFGFILNSAGMAALWSTLEKDELKKTAAELKDVIKTKISNGEYVSKHHDDLKRKLLSPWIILLHIFNIVLLLGLLLVLIIGPEKIFRGESQEALGEPLSTWERIIYWFWFGFLVLAYIIRGLSPSMRLVNIYSKAKEWLKENAPKKKS